MIREVSKHHAVEAIVQCEIDEVSKKKGQGKEA